MAEPLVYEPHGIIVADAIPDKSRHGFYTVHARHVEALWTGNLEDRRVTFPSSLSPERWGFIVKALSNLHGMDGEYSEDLVKKLPQCVAPTSKELEKMLRAVRVEPYWPCCWMGRVGRLNIYIGTGEFDHAVAKIHGPGQIFVSPVSDPVLLGEIVGLLSGIDPIPHSTIHISPTNDGFTVLLNGRQAIVAPSLEALLTIIVMNR